LQGAGAVTLAAAVVIEQGRAERSHRGDLTWAIHSWAAHTGSNIAQIDKQVVIANRGLWRRNSHRCEGGGRNNGSEKKKIVFSYNLLGGLLRFRVEASLSLSLGSVDLREDSTTQRDLPVQVQD
jgi:hypothetical protein